jgi:DNA-binding transcriptional ArsR family regulator
VRTAAPIFAALGDETRLSLVMRLSAGGPQSVGRLAAGASVTRQAVAKHLGILAEANLAHGDRAGREVIWRLDPQPLDEARHAIDRIAAEWDSALTNLKRFLEQPDQSTS